MELVNIILAAMCINVTCPENEATQTPLEVGHTKFSGLERELHGKHIRITTIQNAPLSYAVQENGSWVGKGIAFEIVQLLQDKYGFEYSVVLPEENTLGSNTAGVFGMLNTNKADVVAAFLPLTARFYEYGQYSSVLDYGEWVVLMKRPKASATGAGLLQPFQDYVWLLIVLSVLMVGPVIYGMIRLRGKLCKSYHVKVLPLQSCMWFVYGAILKQGSTLSPEADSTRLLFATWWIFITILTAFYTANLTAFLTLSEFTLPIKDVKDIAVKKYSWVSGAGSAIEEATKNPQGELHEVLKGTTGIYLNESRTVILDSWVGKSNFMYIGEKQSVQRMMFQHYMMRVRSGVAEERDKCTFVATTWSVLQRDRAFAFDKNFRFIELFDSTLHYLLETGIVKNLIQRDLPYTQICPLNLGNKERQLRNSDLLLTYYIVAGGFIIATILFVFEITIQFWDGYTKTYKSKVTYNKTISKLVKEPHFQPPPPSYAALLSNGFNFNSHRQRKTINGRDYWVTKSDKGSKLIPIRTPSAILFLTAEYMDR